METEEDVPGVADAAVTPPTVTQTADVPTSPLLVRETIAPVAHGGERALWHGRKERISYASCNESSFCEQQALRRGPGKRLFCVTAGGGRVIDLLVDGADEVWAVDLNPSQNHLLELKIVGIEELSHDEYLRLMGVRTDRDRAALYARLRPRLTVETRAFFDANPSVIAGGVLYHGCLERFLARVILPILRTVRPFWVRRLMAATTLDEQRRLLHGPCTRLWRGLVSTLVRRRFFEWFSGEAGFWRYLPAEFPLHTRIVDNTFGYLENLLARDNHLASLVFTGRYINEAALPSYLQPEPYQRIKAVLANTRVRLITGTVGDAFYRAPTAHFDGFALSDISSYLDDVSYRGVLDQVRRTARPGARLCSRGIMFHRPPPAELAAHLHREPDLEHTFTRDDASMVHEFVVGELA